MTQREFFGKIANLTNVDAELVEFATDAIAKMDTQAASRRAKQAEKTAAKQAEKAPIRDALLEVMGDAEHPMTASMLIAELGDGFDVKPASVPSLLRPLVESGIVAKVDMKITGKGTQRGYVRV